MLTFGFATMMSKKNLKAKNVSLSFFYYVKNGNFFSCPNSIGDTLQKRRRFFAVIAFPDLKHNAHN